MAITYENNLVLVSHFIKHDSLAREAVITFALSDSSGVGSAQAFADDLQNLAANTFDDYIDTNAKLMRTTTLKGNGTTAFTVGTSTAAPRQGTNPMSSVPPNTALLVQKRTALGGRKGRGRVYLPWMLNEANVDEIGAVNQAYITPTQAMMDTYYAGYAGQMVIANRLYDLPWSNPARKLLAVTKGALVTKLVVSPIAATQRRRMPRV